MVRTLGFSTKQDLEKEERFHHDYNDRCFLHKGWSVKTVSLYTCIRYGAFDSCVLKENTNFQILVESKFVRIVAFCKSEQKRSWQWIIVVFLM